MIRRIVQVSALFALAAPAWAAEPIDTEAFVALLLGEYDSRRQQLEDQRAEVPKEEAHMRVNRRFSRVDAPAVGDTVVVSNTIYGTATGGWNYDELEFMVWTVTPVEDGTALLMSPRRFKDIENRLPFAYAPEKLGGFTDDDLETAIGGAACEILWTKSNTGYSGRTKPCRVMSETQNKMFDWTWTFELDAQGLWITFEGTDGKTRYGTPIGKPYRLDRVSSSLPGHSGTNTRFVASEALKQSGFPLSNAVVAGDLVFLSGALGTVPGQGLVEGGIEAETRQTMKNIQSLLAEQGLSMNSVVKCTAMLADMAEWPAFNGVYKEFFSGSFPARSAFGASGLAANARVEVECIAAR